MRLAPGVQIASGRTSEVFEFGNDSVIKILRPGVPRHWVDAEAALSRAVQTVRVPAPEVRDVTEVAGRPAIVFERVFGPSMWQLMLDEPSSVALLTRQLAAVQQTIHAAGLPAGVGGLSIRLRSKIMSAVLLSPDERVEACAIVDSLPRGAALLHGDLHPGNVLMGKTGPSVIDWFDASIGHPTADIVRSSLLVRPSRRTGLAELPHLPGGDTRSLGGLHQTYLDAMSHISDEPGTTLQKWESVVAAGRLAEEAQPDDAALLTLWARRNGSPTPSGLVAMGSGHPDLSYNAP